MPVFTSLNNNLLICLHCMRSYTFELTKTVIVSEVLVHEELSRKNLKMFT